MTQFAVKIIGTDPADVSAGLLSEDQAIALVHSLAPGHTLEIQRTYDEAPPPDHLAPGTCTMVTDFTTVNARPVNPLGDNELEVHEVDAFELIYCGKPEHVPGSSRCTAHSE